MKATSKLTMMACAIGAVFTFLNLSGEALASELMYKYCNLPLCTQSADKGFFKYVFGLGENNPGWWNCRVQGQCVELSNDISKLKVDERECTSEKLESFRKDIADIKEKLDDVISKFKITDESAKESHMVKGLNTDLMDHFKKCYDAGFFKPDTTVCLTDRCTDMLSQIDKLQVDPETCDNKLKTLYQEEEGKWVFEFEQKLVKDKLDAFKDKCATGA